MWYNPAMNVLVTKHVCMNVCVNVLWCNVLYYKLWTNVAKWYDPAVDISNMILMLVWIIWYCYEYK